MGKMTEENEKLSQEGGDVRAELRVKQDNKECHKESFKEIVAQCSQAYLFFLDVLLKPLLNSAQSKEWGEHGIT